MPALSSGEGRMIYMTLPSAVRPDILAG
jgi:hypothetical protein